MDQSNTHDLHESGEQRAWPEELVGWTLQREQQRGDCVAMLTHDARNRLSIILNYVEILRESARGRGVRSDQLVLESIRANCHALHSLITSCLNVSQVHAVLVDPASIDLNVVLDRVLHQFAPEAERRRLRLEYPCRSTLPPIEGDARALERVFANLIQNALKFTPTPGTVVIAARQRADEVVVSVTDSGPGLTAEHAALLTGLHGGSTTLTVARGLGLRIVRALVSAHGGRVEVSSVPHSGTCISVSLRPTAAVADGWPSVPIA